MLGFVRLHTPRHLLLGLDAAGQALDGEHEMPVRGASGDVGGDQRGDGSDQRGDGSRTQLRLGWEQRADSGGSAGPDVGPANGLCPLAQQVGSSAGAGGRRHGHRSHPPATEPRGADPGGRPRRRCADERPPSAGASETGTVVVPNERSRRCNRRDCGCRCPRSAGPHERARRGLRSASVAAPDATPVSEPGPPRGLGVATASSSELLRPPVVTDSAGLLDRGEVGPTGDRARAGCRRRGGDSDWASGPPFVVMPHYVPRLRVLAGVPPRRCWNSARPLESSGERSPGPGRRYVPGRVAFWLASGAEASDRGHKSPRVLRSRCRRARRARRGRSPAPDAGTPLVSLARANA